MLAASQFSRQAEAGQRQKRVSGPERVKCESASATVRAAVRRSELGSQRFRPAIPNQAKCHDPCTAVGPVTGGRVSMLLSLCRSVVCLFLCLCRGRVPGLRRSCPQAAAAEPPQKHGSGTDETLGNLSNPRPTGKKIKSLFAAVGALGSTVVESREEAHATGTGKTDLSPRFVGPSERRSCTAGRLFDSPSPSPPDASRFPTRDFRV